MKRIIFALCMTIIVVMGMVATAFADAATYDVKKADFSVIVKTPDGGLNMRYGPGTNYDSVMPKRIPDNVKLYITAVSDNWGYTSYNGYDGWVALSQTVKVTEKTPVKAGYTVYVKTPDGGVNMRTGPGTDNSIIVKIADDVALYVEETLDNWGHIKYNGQYGWIALSQTTTTPPASVSVPVETKPVETAPAETTPAEVSEETKTDEESQAVYSEEKTAVEDKNSNVQTESVAEAGQNSRAEAAESAMFNQIILIAIVVLLIIVIAVLLIVIVNTKARR